MRRWCQFSLRALMIVVAVAACLAYALMKATEPYRQQRQVIALIGKLGGTYRAEEVDGWLRHVERDLQDVVVVDLAGCDRPDAYLPDVGKLAKLRTLVIGG